MLRRKLACIVVMAATLALGSTRAARAATIVFVPPHTTVGGIGTIFDVDVVVSGASPTQVVSAYDLDVGFDASVIAPLSVTFGADLGPLFPGVLSDSTVLPGGVLNVFQLSILLDFELLALQTSSVTLFTMQFETLAFGTSSLSFLRGTDDIKGVESAIPFVPSILTVDTSTGSVDVVAVAEPTTSGLLLLAVVGFYVRRRLGNPSSSRRPHR